MKYNTIKRHIDRIRSGDTVIHEGKMRTVSGNNLKVNGFCGTTLFGDSYRLGTRLVEVALLNNK